MAILLQIHHPVLKSPAKTLQKNTIAEVPCCPQLHGRERGICLPPPPPPWGPGNAVFALTLPLAPPFTPLHPPSLPRHEAHDTELVLSFLMVFACRSPSCDPVMCPLRVSSDTHPQPTHPHPPHPPHPPLPAFGLSVCLARSSLLLPLYCIQYNMVPGGLHSSV